MAELLALPGPPTSAGEDSRTCYIEAAPQAEVLFDQLAFLLDHAGPSCPRQCPHCARLAKVQSLLLAPFQAPIKALAPPGPIAA
jgi:hypothetical protein